MENPVFNITCIVHYGSYNIVSYVFEDEELIGCRHFLPK
jgi:hypothetical protein